MTKNQVMLYKQLVNFPDDHQKNLAEVMTVQHNLMVYGYMLDENGFDQLVKTDLSNIKTFYSDCEEMLKDLLGGKHSYKSLYDNFPNDILSMEVSELYWNQIRHYWGQKRFPAKGLPKDEAFEYTEYKMIKGTNEDGIMKVYTILAESGQSLTPLDKKVLTYFANSGLDLPVVNVPFKENLAELASILPGFKVATVVDVLRIAVKLSGGDPSLPALPKRLKRQGPKYAEREKEREAFKFKLNDKNKLRVLHLFENSNLSLSDLNQGSRYGRFIRLAEILRTQDHKETFPKTFQAFNTLRNQKRKGKPDGNPKIRTWYSQVDSQFKLSFYDGLTKLSERPGEFMRRLDYLFRSNSKNEKNTDMILEKLGAIVEKSSNKVIFEVYDHYERRLDPVNDRSIFVKGARNRTKLPNLPGLRPTLVSAIQDTLLNSFRNKLRSLPEIGKVYIDEELKKIPLPTNMRSLAESLTPVIRGQRTPLGEGKVIRNFIHWYDDFGNEDLDLHGWLISDSASMSFGYNGAHKSDLGCYSGDVRCRKGPCAEYVDIIIEQAIKAGYKYYVTMVNNFQGRGLASVKDCVGGFMMREDAQANSTWKPDTIANAMRMQSTAQRTLMGAYDLTTKEYIHLDLDYDKSGLVSGSTASNFATILSRYISNPKISVYDLLTWHAEARGSIGSKDSAETHFMFDDFKSDYTAILPWLGV